jgi:serine/threonine-protein kinase
MFMELLQGSAINELIATRGRLQPDEALEIAAQAAEGLAAAHAAGIVHRDIKPDNLFLCAGSQPFVKLLDFGISKFNTLEKGNHALTTEGATLGTPYYMSPEQVLGSASVDARTDIYSLGVVLYECLTGKRPFDADGMGALAVKIHSGEYAPVSSEMPHIPAEVEQVIRRAMAVDRQQRQPSAAELAAELRACQRAPVASLAPTEFPLDTAPTVAAVTDRPFSGRTTGGITSSLTSPADSTGEATQADRRKLWLLAGGGLLGVAAVITFFAARGAPDPAAASDATEIATAEQATRPEPRSAEPAAAPPPEPARAEPPGPTASAPAPSAAKAPAARPPARAPAGTTPSSRARRDGLTEENPF